MKYTVKKDIIKILGSIWQPLNCFCAQDQTLTKGDIENCKDDNGQITRDSVERWLSRNAGDFRSIEDFEIDFDNNADFHSSFEKEENEMHYLDCMFSEDSCMSPEDSLV